MKIAISFLLLVATSATFASSGIMWSKHYTIRTAKYVCAIDKVKLDTGRVLTERSCFFIK
jgi:hypothetical protein